MLRINVTSGPDGATIALEGRLIGPWVAELDGCWQRLRHSPVPICVELDGVSFIDAGGRALLDAMYADGVELIATDVMMRAVVEEIAARAPRSRR